MDRLVSWVSGGDIQMRMVFVIFFDFLFCKALGIMLSTKFGLRIQTVQI